MQVCWLVGHTGDQTGYDQTAGRVEMPFGLGVDLVQGQGSMSCWESKCFPKITVIIIIPRRYLWCCHHEFTRFIWWMQTQRQVAANPQTKPIDLAVSPPVGRLLSSTSTIAKGWYSFYHPIEGRRLSRPRHCSKGAQPVPKAVYPCGWRDKHNCPRWDSNLGPFTPQSYALTTRPLRPLRRRCRHSWRAQAEACMPASWKHFTID